jgi:hypothetical protein
MDVERARAIAEVADKIIDSAKVEVRNSPKRSASSRLPSSSIRTNRLALRSSPADRRQTHR